MAHNSSLSTPASSRPASTFGAETPTGDGSASSGTELHRYFSLTLGVLISVRSDGITLRRGVDSDWRVLSRKKAACPMAQWLAGKQAIVAELAGWQLAVSELPSLADLMAWDADGICDTPTGHRVEPDGAGPDGVPSWLPALKMI